MRKLTFMVLGAAILVTAVLGLAGMSTASAETVFSGRFNNGSNIIRGGTLTKSEFTSLYNQNKTGDLPAIFSHYGINPSEINSAKEGIVHADGRVTVNGQTVATNAWSLGRQTLGSPTVRKVSIGGKTYYEKPLANAIGSHKAVSAFVFLDNNGKYKSAIIKSCGNPITATPTEPPKKPAPKPQPAATCKVLTSTIQNRDQFTLKAQATVSNGATVSGYHYIIKDNAGKTVLEETVNTSALESSISGELPAGTYSAEVIVKTSVGDKTGKACKTTFRIEKEEKPPVKKVWVCEIESGEIIELEEDAIDEKIHSTNLDDCEEEPVTPTPTPTPEKPEVPQELPQTGLADIVAGFVGIGSVAASVSYYAASRRGLLNTIFNR